MKEIKTGQIWKYNGPGIGRGVNHLITELEKDWSDGLLWVITWSEPLKCGDIGGFTWKGPINIFTREFTKK